MVPYQRLFKTYWKSSNAPQKRRLVLSYFLYFVVNLLGATFPILYGIYIESIQRSPLEIVENTWLYGVVYVLINILQWAFHGPGRLMERKLAFDVSQNFLSEKYDQLLELPLNWHESNHSGNLSNRLRKSYTALKRFIDNGFIYVQTLLQLIFSIVAMLYFVPLLGLLAMTLGFVNVWITLKFDKILTRGLSEYNEKEHRLSAGIADTFTSIATVIILRLEGLLKLDINKRIDEMYPAFRKVSKVGEIKWFTGNTLISLIYVSLIVGYVYRNYLPGETFYVGGLIALIGYVSKFTNSFNSIAYLYSGLLEMDSDIVSAQVIQNDYSRLRVPPIAGLKTWRKWDELVLENIMFEYPSNKDNIQEDHKFYFKEIKVSRGKPVAIIGKSGSGKSTLFKILSGLEGMNPSAHIKLDGLHLSDPKEIGHNSTLITQNMEIFENTIEFNLTFGGKFTQDEVTNALNVAEIKDVIEALPNGMNTLIRENGANLSGGQIQRLAIARAVLFAQDSQLLLFDEITSNLDKGLADRVIGNLLRIFPKKAILASIHNLSLLKHFDYMYQLEMGEIVYEGKPREILY